MTIPELVIVLGIIVTLGFSSIPAFFYLRTKAHKKEFYNTVIEIKAGIKSWQVKKTLLNEGTLPPPFLDHNPSEHVCLNCFDEVLEKEIASELWYKKDNETYLFFASRDKKALALHYDPATGQVSVK